MHTDEYQISLSREIVVCRSKIESARKAINRLETEHGISSEAILTDNGTSAAIPADELAAWREEAAVLAAWTERLAQYQALYDQHKK